MKKIFIYAAATACCLWLSQGWAADGVKAAPEDAAPVQEAQMPEQGGMSNQQMMGMMMAMRTMQMDIEAMKKEVHEMHEMMATAHHAPGDKGKQKEQE